MIELNFKDYMLQCEMNTVGTHNDGATTAFLSSAVSGSEAGAKLPGIDLVIPNDIPTVKKTSVIRVVERNKNPIHISLDDGTRLYLTWDEFRRVGGCQPEPGKKMTITFQRRGADTSVNPSQVQSCFCF